MVEIYKDIEGYEQLYQISNQGTVKSFGNGNSNNSKERILKPAKDKDGYLYVCLSKQGKRKYYRVHRLVCQAFISNPNNLSFVNHRNEIKTDNRASNLEWCDCSYNINYGTRNQIVAEKLSKQVLCVETGKIYTSAMEVQRHLGFDNSNISKCCNGRCKQAYGYTWKFVS